MKNCVQHNSQHDEDYDHLNLNPLLWHMQKKIILAILSVEHPIICNMIWHCESNRMNKKNVSSWLKEEDDKEKNIKIPFLSIKEKTWRECKDRLLRAGRKKKKKNYNKGKKKFELNLKYSSIWDTQCYNNEKIF